MLKKINADAASFYRWWLTSGNASTELEYVRERGISEKMQQVFEIGASPKYGDTLYRHLIKKYPRKNLLNSGLFLVKEDGSIVDKFYSRVMFPIKDAYGTYIGFGARKILGSGPKYINSSQTELFIKRKNLYAFDKARKARADFYIVCEGYMDVIALHQAGFTNAVASLGTALTIEHCKLMKQSEKKVLLLYDSDDAGMEAAEKAALLCKENDLYAAVVRLDGAKDPDEYIKKFGRESFLQSLGKCEKVDAFLIKRATQRYRENHDIKSLSDFLIKTYKTPEEIINAVKTI